MKKLFFLISAAVILSSCTNQGNADKTTMQSEVSGSESSGAAVFSFESSSYDFGKVKEGEKVTHSFKFKNTGTAPLIINDAEASCGCTIPEYPKEPIAPGGEGEIQVVFNSAGRFGKQSKVITISSNADPSTTELYLTGEVLEKK